MRKSEKVMKLQKLVVSCGGTGGHFYPGLSVAGEFQKKYGEVLLLLSGAHAEEQSRIAENAGIRAVALPPMPHYRKNPFRFISGFLGGYFAAKRRLKEFSPQAMLGMGSFATLPVVLAAKSCRIPLFLHDGNARVGKANRKFSKWAKFAGTAFPAVNADKCRCQVMETGMPLRPELLGFAGMDKGTAIEALNREFSTEFSKEKPLIAVTGGSQGAAVFNQILPEALKCCGGDYQVIHLCGKGKLADAEKGYADAQFPYLLRESTGKMAEIMAGADLVFSRSGGSTAAELALFGVPSVLIPYPYAAEGHQMDNARYFERHGAAVVVENSQLTVARAQEIITGYLNDPEKFRNMGKRMGKLGRPQASVTMIEKISAALD